MMLYDDVILSICSQFSFYEIVMFELIDAFTEAAELLRLNRMAISQSG